jgi:hypothetical protein
MYFTPLDNLSNISSGANTVEESCFQLDSRNFPHVVWKEEKNGYYIIKYKFWNGISWDFYGNSEVHRS